MSKWKISGSWLEYTAGEAEAGWTVESLLKERLSISGRMIQRLTRKKGIFLNRKQPFLQKKVKAGDLIKVNIEDKAEPVLPPVAMDLCILYEDDAVLVLNKPAGIIVHPVNREQDATLAHGIAYYWQSKGKRCAVRPVHRLDKDTTGAILIAGSGYIHQMLDKELREHRIRRTYLALVEGHAGEEGEKRTFADPIDREPGHAVRRRVDVRGEKAVTHYTVRALYPSVPGLAENGATLVEVELETGRTHQIRVHFSHHGHPLLGDRLYGAAAGSGINRQMLHAVSLSFCHPVTGEKIECSAEIPEDMRQLMGKLQM
ncbi:RluA family pseudouridine synthase [Aneurinibacillus terranovensis]|uniref:RluA family pseudouridine synthase n=1 Tax=Aneurinibacillus terranovensis TaxID=278991 RepID=UPI00041B8F00|nr:RluA family pseudouridine synthase [Aneurinibacillus terranovensis]